MFCTVLYYSCSLDGLSDVMRLIYITVCITVHIMNRSHKPVYHNFHLHCIYCTVPHYAMLYSVLQYCTVFYCTVLYCTVLYCTI